MTPKVILVGSGKGGVGKSTVAVNLAIAQARQGKKVALLDADVYGPSIPVMLGLRRVMPRIIKKEDGTEKFAPFFKFGIHSISIGYFMEEARSLLWRGPAVHSALQKMISDVEWPDLDYLFIDLPPGTGDVQVSLTSFFPIHGAIVVCTPQEVAALDAVKAINAFSLLNIPLIGLIENMAGFTLPNGETHHIFGQGKVEELCMRFNAPFLGSIPLMTEIRIGGDEGYPASVHDGGSQAGRYFLKLAEAMERSS